MKKSADNISKSYVLMNCELGSKKEVISSLKEINGVKEAHGALSLYDIIVQVELEYFLLQNLSKLLNAILYNSLVPGAFLGSLSSKVCFEECQYIVVLVMIFKVSF